jgi:translation initiation factor IF-2
MVKLYVAKMRIIRRCCSIYRRFTGIETFKDDVKDVAKGYDCGIQVKGYNDIERDVIESYHGSS